MSPPRGGDSWKWSDTENQSKPLASANFHSLRISSSGPPMWPMWMPNFMCEAPFPVSARRDPRVDDERLSRDPARLVAREVDGAPAHVPAGALGAERRRL